MEAVWDSLWRGGIWLDHKDCFTTINAAGAWILKVGDAPPAWARLSSILSNDDRLVLDRLIRRARRTGRAAEQSRLTRGSAGSPPMPVALTATALRGVSSESRGVVLVIEDLSELLAAQRAAAWSEVAKRIAHEIKNPLTPIQLSAERIARNNSERSS